MKKAVLFIFWNRPEYTKKVVEQIKIAKPPKLYLASDGARNPEESRIVTELRKWVVSQIDWPCKIKTRFLENNSGGCANGVSGAVTWFFENEPDGIILEDDIVPHQSFFTYCEELLDRYKENKRVWHITGQCDYEDHSAKESYYFAQVMHCWGWASWADRWRYFSLDLSDYDESKLNELDFGNTSPPPEYSVLKAKIQKNWHKVLHQMQAKEIDTWDCIWSLWIIAHKGLCINPYKNLTSNIGVKGVHFSGRDPFLNRPTYNILPLVHPEKVEMNIKAVCHIYRYSYSIGLNIFVRIIRRLSYILHLR